ncbi:MAG: hypothetical protein J6L60_03140 [Bacteroidaceae bacterium]|nr:hypothetical protein [Bacteroidaceae bacterium]
MKKNILSIPVSYICFLVLTLGLTACEKEVIPPNNNTEEPDSPSDPPKQEEEKYEPEVSTDDYEIVYDTQDGKKAIGYRVFTAEGMLKWLYATSVEDPNTPETDGPNKNLGLELMKDINMPDQTIVEDTKKRSFRFAAPVSYDKYGYPTNSNWKMQWNFSGTIEGNGYNISGFRMFNDGGGGLVASLDSAGVVRNLTICDAKVRAFWGVGFIAGTSNGLIENCHVREDCKLAILTNNEYEGGIVGKNYGTIIGCTNAYHYLHGKINHYKGGIAGLNDGTIIGCINYGTIKGHYRIGGITGNNTGSVIACGNTAEVSGVAYAGGIVGFNEASTDVVGSWTAYIYNSGQPYNEQTGFGRNDNSSHCEAIFVGNSMDINEKIPEMNAALKVYNWEWVIAENPEVDYPTLRQIKE